MHTAALPALLVVVGLAIGSVPCVLHRCGEVCEYHCLACGECYCEVCDGGFGCKGDVGISSNDAAVVDGETFAFKEYLAPRPQVQEATMDILAVAPASELRADSERRSRTPTRSRQSTPNSQRAWKRNRASPSNHARYPRPKTGESRFSRLLPMPTADRVESTSAADDEEITRTLKHL